MRTITRFAAALLAVIGLSAFAWADIQVDNVSALSGLVASGETYSFVQFRLDDQRFTVTGAAELGNVVWVKSIGVVQRPDYTIAENSTLRIQQSTAENETSGISSAQNEAVIAISQPLASSSTETLTVGTLRTYTFAAPFPLKKNTLYTAKFYNASGTAENQSIAMYNDSTNQTTQNKNTTIHASADALFSPCVRIIAVEPSKLADVGASANWSGLWGEAPTEMDTVGLNVTAANAALTMGTTATVAGLAIGSETAVGPLTLTGSGSLTSTTTTIATDTDVSAITANLGAVTLASGKTLTMRDLVFSSITSDGGALCFKGGRVRSALLQTFNGAMTLRDGANVTLPNQYTMTSKQRFIADSGNATLELYNENNNEADGVVDVDEDETIQVKAGATLTLKARDLGGWNGYKGANLAVAVRGERAKITAGSYDSEPGCFVGRVVLADGGEIAGGNTASAALNFYGGTSTNADYPEIYVPSGTGTWSGYLWRNKGLIVKVEEDATFVLSGTLKSKNTNNQALTKVGAGEMKITAAQAENSGDYIINEGTLTFVTEDELTLSNTISGSGTVKKSGAGTLSLTGTVSTSVTVSAGTLKLRASVPSGSITVAGGRLEMPLPSSAKTVTAEGNEGTLVLILTDDQVAEGDLTTQLSWTGDVSKVEVRNSNGALLPRTVSKDNESDVLVLSPRVASTKRWDPDSASWEAGLSGFALGDNVVFGNNASGTITVPVKTTVGTMTVNGTYAFTLSPGGLTASTITVAGSAKATFTPMAVNYVRLQLDNANGGDGDNAVPGVSELILTKGGTKVDWPQGTTIKQVNLDGSEDGPTWASGGNEKVNALIDGVWNGSGTDLSYTNPNGSGGTYSGDYVSVNNNKWWPRGNAKAYAVISLGKAIDFDGYKLMTTDYGARSARNWTLEVSADGKTWFVADSRTDRSVPNTNSFYVYDNESGSTIFPVVDPVKIVSAPIEVESNGTLGGSAKITGNVTFAMGSILDATTKQPLEITGTVTATGTEEYPAGMILVNLPPNAVVWPVLKTTTEGLAAKLFHYGYEFHYREGTYWATLTVTAEVTANSNLTALTWKRADNSDEIDVATREQLFALPEVTATLNTTRDAAVTIDCATVPALRLSGSAAVTLSAAKNVTPTIASLTVAADSTVAADLLNHVTGAVSVAENKTLSLSGSGVSLTKSLTGAGKVSVLAGCTVETQASLENISGDISVAGTLTLNGATGETVMLKNAGANVNNASIDRRVSVAKNGVLKLTRGIAYAHMIGEGTVQVTGSGFTFGQSASFPNTLTCRLEVLQEAALKVVKWRAGGDGLTPSALVLNGSIVSNGSTGTSEYPTYSPLVTVKKGCTLSGGGTLDTTTVEARPTELVFENGAVLDVTAGVPTAAETTFRGELLVKVDPAPAAGTSVMVLKGATRKPTQVALTGVPNLPPALAKVGTVAEDSGLVIVVPSVPTEDADGAGLSEPVQRALQEAAVRQGMETISTVTTLSGSTQGGKKEVLGDKLNGVVELFSNILSVTPTTEDPTAYTATVSYEFGVSDITVKRVATATANLTAQLYVVVCAKVERIGDGGEGAAADYANGTTVSLWLNDATPEGVVTLTSADDFAALGLAPKVGEKWFAVPLANLKTVTNNFTVRASNTTP